MTLMEKILSLKRQCTKEDLFEKFCPEDFTQLEGLFTPGCPGGSCQKCWKRECLEDDSNQYINRSETMNKICQMRCGANQDYRKCRSKCELISMILGIKYYTADV